jgi:hypothetical protein
VNRLKGLGRMTGRDDLPHPNLGRKAPLVGHVQPSTGNKKRRTSSRGFLRRMKSRRTGDGASGSHRTPMIFRGSRRRLRQIAIKGNSSLELWLLVAWVVFLLVVVLPWMVRHSH